MNQRVAIIGAGPSGLSQLHAFEKARLNGIDIPEIVCFEKQKNWGGLWNYTWRTGLDEHGEPVHGSMYRYLWSNGPKECLEFADYTFSDHFQKNIPSFPPRPVLYDYITGRAKSENLDRYIQFETVVRRVEYDQDSDQFQVVVEDLKTQQEQCQTFDYVIVATGHFSIPNVPHLEGIESFSGRVMHSHDFRDAEEFRDRNTVVIGSSYSAEDIALQMYKYGARSVTIGYRSSPMGFNWPEGIKEVPLPMTLQGKSAQFADGTDQDDLDAIILCTGYLHSFPFLEDSLRLKTHNCLYPDGLYKGIFWQDNPKLMYLGMQDQYYTFTMFDAQAWYARDVILGNIALPEASVRLEDMTTWKTREEALSNPFEDIDFQTDYIKDLCAATDYEDFDLDAAANAFKTWEHHKVENILTYRDQAFVSPCNGEKAPVHHTPWLNALDDSMAAFLATEKELVVKAG